LIWPKIFFELRQETLPDLSINNCRGFRFGSDERKSRYKESVIYVDIPFYKCKRRRIRNHSGEAKV
jgi:hypothetical protein